MSKNRFEITVLIIYLIFATIPTGLCATSHVTSYSKVITENDNGKTITIKKGDTLYLRLKENPSTGYSWKLNYSRGLSLLKAQYNSSGSSKIGQRLIVGAAGSHSWQIKAVTNGMQQIKGVYKRSWENKTGKRQTFTLNVKVV
jgi:inhibitor of cysteine peptidase